MSILLDPKKPNVDIVLVHGVNVWGKEKHAADTWTCDTPDGRVHWVRDFLPIYEETSRARVLAHEYDASAVWGTGPRAVGAEADRLLDWLHVQRKGCAARPIIFLAHSLGGLLVKAALVRAKRSSGKSSTIWYFTTGIMFFGTPHRGVDSNVHGKVANLFQTLNADRPDTNFLTAMDAYAPEIDRLYERFSEMYGRYQFVTVYETRPHKIKPLGVIVPRNSAVLGLPDGHETRIALDRDHTSICKFASDREHEFQAVFANFVLLCQEATTAFKTPGEPEPVPVNPTINNYPPEPEASMSFEQALLEARAFLNSKRTASALRTVDEEIRKRQSSTNGSAMNLVPQITLVMPVLSSLVKLGLTFGAYLMPTLKSTISMIVGGLDDIETDQEQIYHLARLSLSIMSDGVRDSKRIKKKLEKHLSSELGDSAQKTEAQRLIAGLDAYTQLWTREIRNRQPQMEEAYRRVQETEDFKSEFERAQDESEESFLEWLVLLIPRLLVWLQALIIEIGVFLGRSLSSLWT
ncbi:unnamed protein product [Clonostachys rhizophaga]|uniref:DUF676 domain-containing protein n=1 Tax=Clonostachys rhizophaga TaxID=160324 RepID=A0A9N9VPE8_9HYPO|nr:unnamed protein product [Clonostachys rhizophaga]